jgi:hypothetical protein
MVVYPHASRPQRPSRNRALHRRHVDGEGVERQQPQFVPARPQAISRLARAEQGQLDNAGRPFLPAGLPGRQVEAGPVPRSTALHVLRARFYHYLLREGCITVDPNLDVDSPKLGRLLPKSSPSSTERLLQAPDRRGPGVSRRTMGVCLRPASASSPACNW